MHGRRFCMRWIIRGWPGPSADGLGPRLALNTARPSTDPRLAPNTTPKRSRLPASCQPAGSDQGTASGQCTISIKTTGCNRKNRKPNKIPGKKKITWITNKIIIIPNKRNQKSKKKTPLENKSKNRKIKNFLKEAKKNLKRDRKTFLKQAKKPFRSSERRSPSAVRPSCPRRSQAAARPSLPLHPPYPEGSEEPPEPPNMPSL